MAYVINVRQLVTNLTTSLNSLMSIIVGSHASLSDLTTTNKTSLLDAINEIDANSGGTASIADGSIYDIKIANDADISADKLADGTTNKVYTAVEKDKLANIEADATANSDDTYLLDRTHHTGKTPVDGNSLKVAVDERQASNGTWPNTDAEATRRVNWIGYPGLSSPPATTGRPAMVPIIDSYTQRPS